MAGFRRVSRAEVPSGERRFRLIHGFTEEHNTQRFRAYVKRLGKAPSLQRLFKRARLKRRLSARSSTWNMP